MNENEPNFELLRRLLALKRHEIKSRGRHFMALQRQQTAQQLEVGLIFIHVVMLISHNRTTKPAIAVAHKKAANTLCQCCNS